ALLRVLQSPELSREMSARGRARCHALTWEASARAHLAVIDRVARLDPAAHPASAGGRPARLEADAVPLALATASATPRTGPIQNSIASSAPSSRRSRAFTASNGNSRRFSARCRLSDA